jgi:Terminase large subunit, T4likevirus-type, N-terminal
MSVSAMVTQVKRVKAHAGRAPAVSTDRSPWEWYAESCPCGLPPGECRAHPRARLSQRPPAGDWRVWAYIAGRGAGKTRAGASWIQRRVDDGTMKLGCLIAPTAADIRDVMVEGPSGLIAVAPAWSRPRFESSKRRVEWPNGARAVCLSGEEPERARGLNIDTLWADELACWKRAQSTWELVMLSLRAGINPQAMITTTPRRLAVLRRILTEATTVQTTDSTYANQAHLPPEFLSQIVSLYENTKLGRQGSMPSFSRQPTVSGSPASIRRSMSPSRPSSTPATSFAVPSTPARRATPRRCSSRCAPILPPTESASRFLPITTRSMW